MFSLRGASFNKGLLGKVKVSFAVLFIALIAIFVINFVLPSMAASGSVKCTATGSYTVCTDYEDYSPEETVLVSGSGFGPNVQLLIKVTRPDGSVVTGDGSFAPWPTSYDYVTTDGNGSFQYNYKLDGIQGQYSVEVLDNSNSVIAATTFTDATTFGISTTGSTNYPTTNNGDATIEGTGGTRASNYIEAWDKFTTTVPQTITSFVLYQGVSGGKGHMHVGLYTDSSGPSSLVSGSDSGSIAVSSSTGWITYTYSTPFYLAPGTYWIVFTFDSDNPTNWIRRNTIGTQYWKTPWTYGSLPSSFPSSPSSATNGPISMYFTGVQIKGYAKATKATLSDNNANIQSVSFYSHATGNFRLAIYSGSSGPSSKQWESVSTAAAASAWNTVNITSGTPTSLTLNSGTYWLAWQWDSANSGPSYNAAGSAGDGNYITQTYGAFPSTWTGGTSSEKWSIYASYSIMPKLTVTKTLVPSSDTGKFNLKIDTTVYATDVSNGGTTGAQYVSIGSHSASETAGTSTSLADYTTVIGGDCAADGSITLAAGDNKVCTITNTKKPKLTVTKIVVNNNGGTKVVANFPLFVDGNSVTSGAQNTFTVGSHTVTETSDSGYTATFSGDCNSQGQVTLASGDVKSCIITNDDKPGTLTVIKHVVNDNSGTKVASNFAITVTGSSPSPASFNGAESPGTTVTLDAGAYSVDEAAVVGYAKALSAGCSGTMTNGGTATCTITNDDITGNIKIIKNTVGGDGTFGFTITGPSSSTPSVTTSGGTGDSGFINVNTGTYTVSETTVPTDWVFTSSNCTSSFDVPLGGSVTCTFQNTLKTCGISANDIGFGNVDPGQVSSEETINVNNGGNTPTTSLTIMGSAWTGGTGMDVGQTHWKLVSGQNYTTDMTALTTVDSSLGQQVSPSVPLPVYFKLRAPEGQSQGSYTQTITFTGSC